MVEMHRVAKFVRDDIVHQTWWKKEQLIVQADSSLARTAAPPGLLAAYLNGLVSESGLKADLLGPWREMTAAQHLQPPPQQDRASLLVADITVQFKLGRRHLPKCQSISSAIGVVDPVALSYCFQRYGVGGNGRTHHLHKNSCLLSNRHARKGRPPDFPFRIPGSR